MTHITFFIKTDAAGHLFTRKDASFTVALP